MSCYKSSWDATASMVLSSSQTGEPLTFDFNEDYPHELLVHQQHGRLPISVSIFMRLSLRPELTKELLARVASIGGPYLGVHVRHTDYRSDYRPLIDQLAGGEIARLFVATDNRKVLDEFRAVPSWQADPFLCRGTVRRWQPDPSERTQGGQCPSAEQRCHPGPFAASLVCRRRFCRPPNGRRDFTKSGFHGTRNGTVQAETLPIRTPWAEAVKIGLD